MSNYLNLTKVLFKNSFSKSINNNKKKKNTQWVLFLIIGLSLLPTMFMFYSIGNEFYDALSMFGQQGLVLVLGFWISAIIVFMFGFFYVINVFYFSSDIENLLSLPLKPSEIIAAKFTVTVIFEYITEIFFLLPILISFGVKNGGGIAYIIYALFIFLTLPIIPLIYSALINMLVMRFTNIGKRKDLFRMLGGIFGLIIGVGINVFIQKFVARGMSPSKIQDMLLMGNNSLLNVSNNMFPGNKYASLSLVHAGSIDSLIQIGIYIAILLAAIIIFLFAAEKLYFKGVIGVSEVYSKRKKLSNEEYNKSVIQSPVIKSYVIKEIKLLLRTPIYFMNCILMNFLWPFFFLLPFLVNPDNMEGFGQIFSLALNPQYADIVLVVMFGLSIFISTTNSITSTSISREGKNIYFNKFIPVSYKEQILAKLLTGIIIGILGTVGVFIIASLFIKLPVYLVLMGIVLSILAVLFTSMAGILMDLRNPKLEWDSEQKAVKQNMNSLVNMLGCYLVAAIAIVPLMIYRTNQFILFAILTAAFLIINFGLYKLIMSFGIKCFKQIEG